MLTQQVMINKVNNFVSDIIKFGIPLEKAYLFGSYSKSSQNDNSDIDVALVSEVFSGFGYEDRKLFSKICINSEYIDIEPTTISKHTYLIGNPFLDGILKTGIEIKIQ